MTQGKRNEQTIAIGRIGGARGVGGGVRVTSYSGEYEHFLGLDEVELVTSDGPGDGGEGKPGDVEKSPTKQVSGFSAAGAAMAARFMAGRPGSVAPVQFAPPAAPAVRKKVKIVDIDAGPGGIVMYFKGYDSPESVRELSGLDIVVPIEKSAPLREGEWYVRDLVGLNLVCAGKRIGTVAGVFDGAADPCLEISLPDGRNVLVPFRKEFVGEVSLETGFVELIAPWVLEE